MYGCTFALRPAVCPFFPLWAAKAPVFTDIIIETTAKTGINKQGELTLFRLLTVLGLLLCCLTGFLLSARQMKHMTETPETAPADKHPAYLCYLWIFVFPLLGSFIIFGQKNTVLLLGLCYFCVLAVCLHFKKNRLFFIRVWYCRFYCIMHSWQFLPFLCRFQTVLSSPIIRS